MSSRPERLRIHHDDYHAKYVGRTSDGRQFFLTTPFEPSIDGRPPRRFVALFLFDRTGKLIEAKIDPLDPSAPKNSRAWVELRDQRLRDLGEIEFRSIEIAPFEIQRFNLQFGLIARPPEDDDESWWVELHPGNYMAFHEPWDSHGV